jgi:dienelactone hydrolase
MYQFAFCNLLQPTRRFICTTIVCILATSQVQADDVIASCTAPPPEFADQFGDYRSPLLFNDGTRVETPQQWRLRRREIREHWMTELGPWPALIDEPRVELIEEFEREGLTWQRIQLEYAPGQMPEAWLLVPEGQGPFPAVLAVYYDPGTAVGLPPDGKDGEQRDFALQLARRGFVTLSIGTPGGNAYLPDLGDAQCQPLSFHAYVAANCWHALARRPEVDPQRIGVTGHSYGGKWAMFAAALWDQFAAVAVSDPGIVFDEQRPSVNYWEPWYLGREAGRSRVQAGIPTADNPVFGAYRRLRDAGHDLHEIHALIAPRPFLVSGGSEDGPQRWVPLNHSLEINALLGHQGRVAMTNRPDHTPTAESNGVLYAFLERWLK